MNEQIKAIRNEIERLKETHERNLKKPMERGRIGFAHGVVECCDRILSFIDSLPEETDNEEPNRPKLSDNLEEAASEYISTYYAIHHREPDMTSLFIAGAQWQKDRINIDISKQVAAAYQLGEKGKEEQMMMDAVEGKIYGCDGLHWIETDADENIKGKEDDTVRIIIVKEDER